MKNLLVIMLVLGMLSVVSAQESPAESGHLTVVDDIQIDLKDVILSPNGDTCVVELFLISLKRAPREFKLNSFASGVVDSNGTPYLYTTMEMGQVRLEITEKQNYLHYLLEQDMPVLLRITTGGWSKQWGKPNEVKLTFEESTEEGKFLEVQLTL